ncbi:hypothetical protein QG37_06276 [Candidozyma auris]|uniref:Uncharacterized protein n=1 Tax=Candidozyma auris TaxID=498019 RepID=A0A0L0NUE0_CANAR|nr:hypothetical protein QG37_06276 [[Candida] auris]
MAAKNELLEYNTHKKNIKRERKKVKKKKKEISNLHLNRKIHLLIVS